MTPLVDLSQDIHELTPGLIALRRALHQHPELAFEEAWTAATLAGRMRTLGLAVQEGIGGTDTELSLKCYRDTLGLRVAGASENYGPEQERLNNVFGARLRITTLRASSGPGVEFLEYLTPRDGRPVPGDTQPNDLVHWQTTLASNDAEAVARAVRGGSCAMLSSGVVAPAERALGFTKGLLIRDGDGHALKVVQP